MAQNKILLIGSGGCGKSVFLQHLNKEEIEKRYIPTCSYPEKRINIGNNNIEFIDTPGQCYKDNYDEYYLDVDAIIVMFDIGSVLSFKRAVSLYQEATKYNKPIILIGNKSDIPSELKRITKDKYNFLNTVPYYEMSSKTKVNEEFIQHLVNVV